MRPLLNSTLAILLMLASEQAGHAQTNLGTAFTYQGQVNHGTTPITGTADVQFRLYGVASGGVALGTSTSLAVPVSAGLFSLTVDFGAAFDGRATWLELAVRYPAGSGSYATLAPRQAMTAAPYALGIRLPLQQSFATNSGPAIQIDATSSAAGIASNGAGGTRGELGRAEAGVYGSYQGSMYEGWLGRSDAGVIGVTSAPAGVGVRAVTGGEGWGLDAYSISGDGAAARARCLPAGTAAVLANRLYAVWGQQGTDPLTRAGYFDGKVIVSGDLQVTGNGQPGHGSGALTVAGGLTLTGGASISGGCTVSGGLTVTNGSKNFRIDHPLEPERKYLMHACVESSERRNLYDGIVRLDERGRGIVDLPPWFEALNGDFRYQLTPIGSPGPDLHIASEISSNRFVIAGGRARQRVSWLVTGVRRDTWAASHPFQLEVPKVPPPRAAEPDAAEPANE